MTKAQEMLAKAGFPDTKQGRAAFHKMYPTAEDFFKVHGNMFKDAPKYIPITLPITPENVILDYSPERENYLQDTSIDTLEEEDSTDMYKSGGSIHIKPSKRGTFTAAAKKHGKSVQAFASQVLANKGNYSPAMVKKANFARNAAKWKHEDGGEVMYGDGGTVDALQLMGMPTPPMYGGGSNIHPTLILSTESNPNKMEYLNSPYYQNIQSIDNRTNLSGAFPLVNNKLNLTGSYGTNNTYTGGLELNLGDMLSGAAGRYTPSKKYDNPDIAHKGHSFIDTYGHVKAGITNSKEGKVLPYFGGDFTAAHQMGRVKGPNGLRQPKGTIYASGELNNVEDPKNDVYVNNNYIRANLGGSYNFGKGLGVYGEAGYDFTRNSPRGEVGLKKTFANGGYIPSYNFGHVQSANNTYMHGYGNGGSVNMYKKGGFTGFLEDAGKFTLNNMAAPIEQISGNNFVNFDYNNKGFADAAAVTEGLIGAGTDIAGTYFGGPVYGMAKSQVQGITSNLGHSTEYQKGASDTANKTGQIIGSTGNLISGIASGNPQQIVSGASNVLGTTGGQLGSKELSVIGQLGGIGSQFVGMGGGMGNKAGAATSITPSGSTNFGTGIPGGDLSNFGIGFAAMGGAVNAPNMMKYAQGGGVDMTEINVEHNELLTDENGNILTEYGSNALPPHPADGSAHPNGTVPAPPGAFVITKALSEKYKAAMKNNDKLHADAMRNNITIDKQRKEAKQAKQAEQEQMMQQQNIMMQQQMMPEDIMSAKYGGMVRGYGYGGGVMKYDGGSGIPPIDESMAGAFGYSNNYNSLGPIFGTGFYNPEAALNNEYIGLENINDDNFNFSSTMNPAVGSNLNPYGAAVPGDYSTPMDNYIQPSSLLTSQLTPNVSSSYMTRNSEDPMQIMSARNAQMLPVTNSEGQLMPIERASLTNPMYDNPDRIPFRRDPGETWGMQQPPVYNPNNITSRLLNTTTNLNTGYGENQGKYPNQIPYKVEKGENWGGITNYEKPFKGGVDPNYLDLLPIATNAALGLEAILQKPFNMNAEDYMIKSKLNPYEEQYRPDYRAYNAALYSSKNNPNLAARTELFNAAQKQFADEKYKVNQGNLARKMQADQYNIGLEGQNLGIKMNIAQLNEQSRAARRNAIREQFGKNIPADIYNYQTNQMTKEALSARYKDHKFSWDQNYG